MEQKRVHAIRHAQRRTILPPSHPKPGQAQSTRWRHQTNPLKYFLLPQSSAAKAYGIVGNPMNNLIKVNVYYTSLNEKITEDVIDYNIEVCGMKYKMKSTNHRMGVCSTLWEDASLSGLASPSATSLRSLSSPLTSLEMSSTGCRTEELGGLKIPFES